MSVRARQASSTVVAGPGHAATVPVIHPQVAGGQAGQVRIGAEEERIGMALRAYIQMVHRQDSLVVQQEHIGMGVRVSVRKTALQTAPRVNIGMDQAVSLPPTSNSSKKHRNRCAQKRLIVSGKITPAIAVHRAEAVVLPKAQNSNALPLPAAGETGAVRIAHLQDHIPLPQGRVVETVKQLEVTGKTEAVFMERPYKLTCLSELLDSSANFFGIPY